MKKDKLESKIRNFLIFDMDYEYSDAYVLAQLLVKNQYKLLAVAGLVGGLLMILVLTLIFI